MDAYVYSDSGCLRRINVCCVRNDPGYLNIGGDYNPTRLTRSGTTTLMGWDTDDGIADIYTTEAGIEVIIPERHTAKVAAHLAAETPTD